jgi:hypothetical protein
MKKVSLVYAFDRERNKNDGNVNGVTAERYNVGGYPTVVIIDRDGKIAFNTSDPGNRPAMEKLVKEMGLDPKTVDEEQAARLIEKLLDQAVADVLNPRSR